MSTIRKRVWGDGKTAWVADYFDGAGKRHIKTFAKKKDADAFLETTRNELRNGTHTPARASITIAEAADLWVAQGEVGHGDEPPLEAATLRQYRQHRDLHIVPFIGATKLGELTVERITYFQNELKAAGRSPAMVKKVTSSLGSILETARSHGKAARNVVRERARDRRGRGGRHKRRLEVGVDIPDKGELRAILEATTGRWRPLIVTAIFTGLRASELRGLRWSDVDFDAGVIRVRQRADEFNTIGSTKSAAARRDVPMAPMVTNTLKRWRLECPKGDFGLVFPNGRGNIENHANIYRRGFGAAQVAAGVVDAEGQAKYGVHAFRHAAASLFIEQNFTPKKLQALMGHASIQMTFDRYGHLFPSHDDDAAAMAAIEARLVG